MIASSQQHPVRRLVSFLGLGKKDRQRNEYFYDEVEWTFDERKAKPTRYVCRALAELLSPQEIVILGTAESLAAHQGRLNDELREGNYPSPEFVEIPRGERSSELWGQFQLIKSWLRGSNGPVMFDITHGFRSQPFFAAAVSAFVRAVDENPPDLRVCYAAREAGDRIWDLTEFVTLLDWAQALRMFLRTGRAQEAADATTRLGRELAKAWVEGGKQGARPDIDNLGRALARFGADLETLRTGDLLVDRGGRRSSAGELYAAARRAKAQVVLHIPPLGDVLDRVLSMVEPFSEQRADLSGDKGRKAVVALAQLYLDLGRYLEAVATVREGWVNLYARKAELDPGGEKFDLGERKAAETRAHECDEVYREVTDRRNDLLHAQYRSRSSAQDADGVKRTVEGLVQKLKIVSCTPRGNVFANVSNHRKEMWDENQTQAALALAEHIEDVPFPAVPPDADEKAIEALADECLSRIPPATSHALVQGEFTLTVALVRRLQARGITCLAATTERQVEEADSGRKTSVFRFNRFREYPQIAGGQTQTGQCK